jgi:hypothetical protein
LRLITFRPPSPSSPPSPLVIGGAIAGVFTLWVLLLLPFALLKGALDRNARGVLRDLLRLFPALLDCVAAYASRR